MHSIGPAGADDDEEADADTGGVEAGLVAAAVEDFVGAGVDDALPEGRTLDEAELLVDGVLDVFFGSPPPGAHLAARKISTSTPRSTVRRRRQ